MVLMWIAWTTVATPEDASRLARLSIEHRLAVCAQVEGPMDSYYRWEGKVTEGREWRITFKCVPERLEALETRILTDHPYETPEWIAVRAGHVGEKYLNWAFESSSLDPLSNESNA